MSGFAANVAMLGFIPTSLCFLSEKLESFLATFLVFEVFEMILLFRFAGARGGFALNLERRLTALRLKVFAFCEHLGEESLGSTEFIQSAESIHVEFT